MVRIFQQCFSDCAIQSTTIAKKNTVLSVMVAWKPCYINQKLKLISTWPLQRTVEASTPHLLIDQLIWSIRFLLLEFSVILNILGFVTHELYLSYD